MKNFFDQIPFFCYFQNGQKSILELGKSLKLPKMQFHEKNFFLIFLISQVFLLDFLKFSGQVTSASDGRKFKIPSKWTRLIMIGIESFGPLILKHWSKTAGVKNPNIFKFLDLFEYVSQFHIIWFYLEETFYQISKRS